MRSFLLMDSVIIYAMCVKVDQEIRGIAQGAHCVTSAPGDDLAGLILGLTISPGPGGPHSDLAWRTAMTIPGFTATRTIEQNEQVYQHFARQFKLENPVIPALACQEHCFACVVGGGAWHCVVCAWCHIWA